MSGDWANPANHEHYAALWAGDVGKRGSPEWNAAYDQNLSDLRAKSASVASPPEHMNQQQFGPFYHGSPRSFKPGDTIDPNPPTRMSGMSREGYAYMSHSPSNAAQYSRGGDLRRLPRGKEGHVYEVEPTGTYGDDPGSPDSYRSPAPLRIKREIPVDKAEKRSVNHFHPDNHSPGYVGRDSEYDSDMDHFDRKWYGD